MRFALLGADPASLALARAACDAGHACIWPPQRLDAEPSVAEWKGADASDDWEQLLDVAEVDAVLMGAGDANVDRRLRRLSELVRAGQNVLAVHPLFSDVLAYYEIDMVRTETGALLRHFNPLTADATIDKLWPPHSESSCLATNGTPTERMEWAGVSIGNIEQLIATRFLPERIAESVALHFARDVELLECLAGRFHRLGAHGGSGSGAYAGLSVQLLGARGRPVRWSVEPPVENTGLQCTLVGASGRLELRFDDQNRLQSAHVVAEAEERDLQQSAGTPESRACHTFFQLVETARRTRGNHAARGNSTWPLALHAMDLADAIETSLRRARMIDVHEQQLTEELAFKGTMAAAGCGLLLLGPPLMLLLGWLAGLMGFATARYWPHALLVFFALFLALLWGAGLLLRRHSDKPAEDFWAHD